MAPSHSEVPGTVTWVVPINLSLHRLADFSALRSRRTCENQLGRSRSNQATPAHYRCQDYDVNILLLWCSCAFPVTVNDVNSTIISTSKVQTYINITIILIHKCVKSRLLWLLQPHTSEHHGFRNAVHRSRTKGSC